MNGATLKDIRKRLGLTTVQFGRALGYTGADDSVASSIRRLEIRKDNIPAPIAILAGIYEQSGPRSFATHARGLLQKGYDPCRVIGI